MITSPNVDAPFVEQRQARSCSIPYCRYRIIVCNSAMLLEIGVPVANTTPRPPVNSSRYWHFGKQVAGFLRFVCATPAISQLCVQKKILKVVRLSSMKRRSMPNSSKVKHHPLRLSSLRRSSRVPALRVRSICLTVKARRIPVHKAKRCVVISSIWRWSMAACRSADSGIFSSCECPMITAS